MPQSLEINSSEFGSHIVSLGRPLPGHSEASLKRKTWKWCRLGSLGFYHHYRARSLPPSVFLPLRLLEWGAPLTHKLVDLFSLPWLVRWQAQSLRVSRQSQVSYAYLPAWPVPRVQNLLGHVSRVQVLVAGTQGENKGSVFPSAYIVTDKNNIRELLCVWRVHVLTCLRNL